jgi:hypothetical protein
MAEFYFPTEVQMQSTLNSPEGQAAVADLPNFQLAASRFSRD